MQMRHVAWRAVVMDHKGPRLTDEPERQIPVTGQQNGLPALRASQGNSHDLLPPETARSGKFQVIAEGLDLGGTLLTITLCQRSLQLLQAGPQGDRVLTAQFRKDLHHQGLIKNG